MKPQQDFVIAGQLIELGQASVLTLGTQVYIWEGRGVGLTNENPF